MERKSWNHGFRHDTLGRPRYKFSQSQILLLYKHNNDLCKLSPFWASIKNVNMNYETFWDLGCTTHRKEVDDFLQLFARYSQANDFQLVNFHDLQTGTGIFEDIVNSGAKGSQSHIDMYRKKLNSINEEEVLSDAVKTFNKYVSSNREMQKVGRQTAGSLHIYQNLILLNGSLQMNGTTILDNFFDISPTSIYLFRPNVIKYHIRTFLKNKNIN